MNEPFSEKSARQVIQQSGQFICPAPPDPLVSAQSVFPQNRFQNNQNPYQTNYQTNYQINRAGRAMPPQAQRTDVHQSNPAADTPGSGQAPLQRTQVAAETAQNTKFQNAKKQESNTPSPLQAENLHCEPPSAENVKTANCRVENSRAENSRAENCSTGNCRTENCRAENSRTENCRTENCRPENRACEETAPENTVCQQNFTPSNLQRWQQNGQDKMCEASAQPLQSCDVAYQAATPYPPIKISGQNSHYAAAMLDNMAGQNSEMSAVGLCFYAHLVTAGYKDVAESFLRISMVEMHHLNLFGELAMQLGENPRLWSRQPRSGRYLYWNPACLKYPHIQPPAPGCRIPETNVRTILAQAIESEQAAIRKYMQQTSWIQDVGICDILRRISADEQMHLEIFSRLYHQI